MDDELARKIGSRARAARTKLDLSQADAAERIEISLEFYGRIERGRTLPSTPTLVRMAVELGMSLDSLTSRAASTAKSPKRSTPAPQETREMRLLLRRIRSAEPKTLRLLTLIAVALEETAGSASSGRPRSSRRSPKPRR